jgi:hypothetical protein
VVFLGSAFFSSAAGLVDATGFGSAFFSSFLSAGFLSSFGFVSAVLDCGTFFSVAGV